MLAKEMGRKNKMDDLRGALIGVLRRVIQKKSPVPSGVEEAELLERMKAMGERELLELTPAQRKLLVDNVGGAAVVRQIWLDLARLAAPEKGLSALKIAGLTVAELRYCISELGEQGATKANVHELRVLVWEYRMARTAIGGR